METVDVLSPAAADASVRPATRADLPAIGGVHARAWTTTYRELVPAGVLPQITPEAMTGAWAPHLDAAGAPRHHLIVACTGPTVVGFAAFGPEGDDGAEVVTLLVDPTHHRRGHASRLLAAGVDLLREDGATHLTCWVPVADEPRRAFLRSAGFGEDGAWRQLATDDAPDGGTESGADGGADEQADGGARLREVRLVASLGT
ncbi:GNAT family N-acetyltransferase [Thalassiella azotivora]